MSGLFDECPFNTANEMHMIVTTEPQQSRNISGDLRICICK